jgi:predicted  nucleic acid-binding Zn-ribbon protein
MDLEQVLSELSGKIGELPTVLDTKVEELSNKIDALHKCVDDKFEAVDKEIKEVSDEVQEHVKWHEVIKTMTVKYAIKALSLVGIIVVSIVVFHFDNGTLAKFALGLLGK